MIERIVSGGQTGVDTGALLAGYALDLRTGGWAPKDWMTEYGEQPEFMQLLGLKESPAGYASAVERNVRDSDGTLLIVPDGQGFTGGTHTAFCVAESLEKPLYVWRWIGGRASLDICLGLWGYLHQVRTLNVVGPSESGWRDGTRVAAEYLLRELADQTRWDV
jgi:hypothetical protein